MPCNVGEMNQVFLNLIVNAAHAIAESGKDCDNRPHHHHDGGCVGDHVDDLDRGQRLRHPAGAPRKIFDPFFTTKPVGKGTGQGLAIARSIIVEKHGGQIDVHSVVGQGTRFLLRLPVGGRSTREGRAMKRILFVDDERPVLEGLRSRLHRLRAQWQMEFVTSGELAIEQLQRQPCDLVVTDMRMPGMDGAKLLEHGERALAADRAHRTCQVTPSSSRRSAWSRMPISI